jgi:hypothetical protein
VGSIDRLFSRQDDCSAGRDLSARRFQHLDGQDGAKEFDYDVRRPIRMGERPLSRARQPSGAWRTLAHDLLSPAYRTVMSSLTGLAGTDRRIVGRLVRQDHELRVLDEGSKRSSHAAASVA